MIKYLKRDNLSSKNNDVKVDAHPRWTRLDMLDYIKPIVRRKPDVLVIPYWNKWSNKWGKHYEWSQTTC